MKRFLLLAAIISLTTGCASIVNGTSQSLSVTARQQTGEPVTATCTLTNNKGSWFATTPGSVVVSRSYNDLAVNCISLGLPTGTAIAKSVTKGMAFGNILFGGVIGAGVDMSTGAAYDYPPVITVTMGEINAAVILAVQAPPIESSKAVVPQGSLGDRERCGSPRLTTLSSRVNCLP